MKHFLSLLACGLLVAGCSTRGPSFDPRQDTAAGGASGEFTSVILSNRLEASLLKPSPEPYRLGPGDAIELETIGDAAGRANLVVGPDGKIYYSLLPGLSVWGLSLPETRSLLQREMEKYAKTTPEFVLNVRGVASHRVYFLGAIASPGVYTLATPTTLLEAISSLGGIAGNSPDDAADLSRSFVLRQGKLLPVDFDGLLKKGDLTQNIYLLPEDFVFIRPTDLPSIYVMGAVASPNIIPYSKDLSLSDAILRAGGTVKFARPGRVAIIRGGLTQPRIATVDFQDIVTGRAVNVRLQPGDIVYVPYIPFRLAAQLAEDILDQFVRTIAVNEGSNLGNSQSTPAPIVAPGAGSIIIR